MLVMKFGGSSVASPASIKRVAAIVQSHIERRPVVIVSALGTTTDSLAEILGHASRGESYLAWKCITELREFHFCVAEDLLGSNTLQPIDQYLRDTFRDLHVRVSQVCEGEQTVTPALKDWVLSLGEQLSSRIVAAAFSELDIKSSHLDSRALILTDTQFTNATPRYWETYAKIRWAVAGCARDHVVVLGGFMGATEDGQTTTLGRGGSDLTATIVGAAINAEEIQIWKEVDGMLTCDPKIRKGLLLKNLSYTEAAELAKAGAKILHPDTIAPAQRLRIPIVLRNTFRPEAEGTSIALRAPSCSNPVKSIACKPDVILLEIRSPRPDVSLDDCSLALKNMLGPHERSIAVLGMSEEVIYLGMDSKADPERLRVASAACFEVHMRSHQAVLTLVGEGLSSGSCAYKQTVALLAGTPALVLPPETGSCSLCVVVPDRDVRIYVDKLHTAFFNATDSRVFAKASVTDAPDMQPQQARAAKLSSQPKHRLQTVKNRYAFPR